MSKNDSLEEILEESGAAAAIFSDELGVLFMSSRLKEVLAARLREGGSRLSEALQPGGDCVSGSVSISSQGGEPGAPTSGSGAMDLGARHAEAREVAEELSRLARRLEELTSGLGKAECRSSLADYGLGPRHIEIARLIESGATTKAIARELGIAEATVKSRLSVIYRKTGVEGRAAFIHFLYKNGIALD